VIIKLWPIKDRKSVFPPGESLLLRLQSSCPEWLSSAGLKLKLSYFLPVIVWLMCALTPRGRGLVLLPPAGRERVTQHKGWERSEPWLWERSCFDDDVPREYSLLCDARQVDWLKGKRSGYDWTRDLDHINIHEPATNCNFNDWSNLLADFRLFFHVLLGIIINCALLSEVTFTFYSIISLFRNGSQTVMMNLLLSSSTPSNKKIVFS